VQYSTEKGKVNRELAGLLVERLEASKRYAPVPALQYSAV
jgi:hypothetical protein